MTRLRWIVAALVLALAGIGAAVALADTSQTVDTFTYTIPAQTYVQSVTVPTVTETVTVSTPAPTTTDATTTVPTTTASSQPSFSSETSYAQNPPAFTAQRTINVSSAVELKAAISNLQPGDLVQAAAPFTVSSSSSTPPLTIANKLSGPAEINLTGVSIVYTGSSQVDGVWLNNPSNVLLYGGDISTSDRGGVCLRVYGSQHVTWWHFKLHDCGGTGFQAQAIGGPVDHDDFEGEITKTGENNAWDPHCSTECGTGQHGANLWDANQTNSFSNNRFAFYAHDIPTGACVEYGNDKGAATGDTLILKCVNATFDAQKQTAGNALQTWGNIDNTSKATLDVKYLEGSNLEGQAYRDAGLASGVDASGITIEYGRASNTNLNPRYVGQTTWQHTHGEHLLDVQPAP